MRQDIAKVNIPLFIVSLVLSFFLWAIVYAQTTPVTSRLVHVPVTLNGFDDSRFKIVSPDPTRVLVNVELVGTAAQLSQISETGITAQADLRNAQPGRKSYTVYLYPKPVEALATNPNPKIIYDIEALGQRKFPIVVTTTGRLNDPTHVYMDSAVSPKTVTVTGSVSDFQKINTARVEVNLSEVDPNRPAPVNCVIRLYDENGQVLTDIGKLEPITADVTPILSPSSVRKTVFLNVPFKGRPADGFVDTSFTVSPNQVSISGSPDVVNGLSQVDTDSVDLTGMNGDRTVAVNVRLPHGVASAMPAQVKVKVSVKKSGDGPPGGQ